MINTDNLKDIIDEFVKIYENRPIKYNPYGTESPHLLYQLILIGIIKNIKVIKLIIHLLISII